LNGIPEGSRATREVFLKKEHVDSTYEKIVKLNDLAMKRDQSLAQMALAWVLKDKRITSVLIGASSVKQIDDNVESLKNVMFSEEELKLIEGILK
jgi:L-glyceraldehyde 3-phosphate reductase